MDDLIVKAPDFSTKGAMRKVQKALRAVARAATSENVVSLDIERKLQFWLASFNPEQGNCFLITPSRVYTSAILAIKIFSHDIRLESHYDIRYEVMRQVTAIDCLREKSTSYL